MQPLFAQAAEAAADAPRQSMVGQLAFPIMIGLFIFVFWLPMMRRQKREAAMLTAGVKTGAKVVLNSGIVGTVVKAKDGEDELVLRSEETKLRVLRSSVARILANSDETESKA